MSRSRPAAGLALLVACAGAAFSAETGTAGANFLHIAAGPRAIGMGEAQTAVAEDAYASYWNPAALTQLRYPEAAFMYNRLYEGIDQQFLAYAHPLPGRRTLAGNLTRVSLGSFESYNANGLRRGSVDASDLSAGAAYGQAFGGSACPELSVGVGAKWIRESLGKARAQTYAGDAGFLVARLDSWLGERARGLKVGAAMRHWGPGLRFHSDPAPLPRTLSVGLGLERRPWGDPVTLALDYRSAADEPASVGFGLEYRLQRVVAVRAGYRTGQDVGVGLRFGIGIEISQLSLEYAIASFGTLGSAHRFGVSVRLGGPRDARQKPPEEFIEQGKRYLKQKRLYEAVVEFNGALEIDPRNAEALQLIKEAAALLQPAQEILRPKRQ